MFALGMNQRMWVGGLFVIVLVLMLGSGCGGDGGSQEDSAADTIATEDNERLVDIEVQGDVMTPDEITLEEDDYAVLVVTTDHPIVFYIRDYGIGEEASPEEPADIDFDAIFSGSFVIEDAETETELGTLIVEPRQEE